MRRRRLDGWDSALAQGARRFRALPLSALAESHMCDNKDSGLFPKTVAVKLGECDAFVSHSWADEGSAKMRHLKVWMGNEEKLICRVELENNVLTKGSVELLRQRGVCI